MSTASDAETAAVSAGRSSLVPMPILAALFVIGPFALQVFLPALPAIEKAFDADPSHVAMAVSLSIVSFAIASLAYGGLADKFGRRPTVLIGLCLLAVGSVVCAAAPNIAVLLGGRIIQAAGGAAGVVAGRAIVVDVYEGRAIVRVMSWMFAAMTLAPIVATPIGGVIVDVVGWRGNLLTVALIAALTMLGSLLFLSETRDARHAGRAEPVRAIQGLSRLIRSGRYLGFVTNHALQMAANVTFLAAAGILLSTLHGMSSTAIGLIYVVGGVTTAIGSYASTRLPGNAYPFMLAASVAALAAGVVAVVLAEGGAWGAIALIAPAAVISWTFGFTGPTVQAGAVSAVPGMQSMASGLLMFVSSVVTAAIVQLQAMLPDDSPLPLAVIMAVCCLGALSGLVVAHRRSAGATGSDA